MTHPPPPRQLYNARTLLVLSADAAPDSLFGGAASGEEPIIDFEGLQFETAVEGGWPLSCFFREEAGFSLYRGTLV
jgi:hypothetical protein